MKSILQDERKCYITGREGLLNKHHIYGGPLRKKSERHGFWVWLIPELHTGSNEAVHRCKSFDTWLKQVCQRKFEETHSREEFMAITGRNFL